MTKDLAILVGPEQAWMTTEQFFEAIVHEPRSGDGRRGPSGERTRSRLTPRPIKRPGIAPQNGEAVEQARDESGAVRSRAVDEHRPMIAVLDDLLGALDDPRRP